MSKRFDHTPKSKAEKEYYDSVIHKLEYEPTYDESLEFNNSNDSRIPETKEEDENKNIRTEPFLLKLKHHFINNKFQWLVGFVIAVLGIFFFKYTWILAETKNKVDNVQNNITNIEKKIDTLTNDFKTLNKNINNSNKELNEKIFENEKRILELEIRNEIENDN